ncbi:ribonuclease 2-5A family protein, partial [Musa troglodytarum]
MLPSPRSVVFYAVLAIGFLVSGVLTPVVLEPSASPYPGLSFPVASTGEISAAEKWSDRLLSTDLVPVEKSPPGVLRAGSRSLMSLDENKHGRFFLALPNGTIYFMNKSTKPQWKLLIGELYEYSKVAGIKGTEKGGGRSYRQLWKNVGEGEGRGQRQQTTLSTVTDGAVVSDKAYEGGELRRWKWLSTVTHRAAVADKATAKHDWTVEEYVQKAPVVKGSVITTGTKTSTFYVVDADSGESIYHDKEPFSWATVGMPTAEEQYISSKLESGNATCITIIRTDYFLDSYDLNNHLWSVMISRISAHNVGPGLLPARNEDMEIPSMSGRNIPVYFTSEAGQPPKLKAMLPPSCYESQTGMRSGQGDRQSYECQSANNCSLEICMSSKRDTDRMFETLADGLSSLDVSQVLHTVPSGCQPGNCISARPKFRTTHSNFINSETRPRGNMKLPNHGQEISNTFHNSLDDQINHSVDQYSDAQQNNVLSLQSIYEGYDWLLILTLPIFFVLCYLWLRKLFKYDKECNDLKEWQSMLAKKRKSRKAPNMKNVAISSNQDIHMLSMRENTKTNGHNQNGSSSFISLMKPNDDSDGRWIGRLFVSNSEIGHGSNGTVVFEGFYDARPVAVKRLLRAHHDVACKEIQNLIASDRHPNIVRWYGVEQDLDFVYISLERCVCSLSDLIHICSDSSYSASVENPISDSSIENKFQVGVLKNIGKDVNLWRPYGLPSIQLLKLMRDIVSGIAHLHELGIIHRDLKPQNVLISNDRHLYAKLSDMGISKRLLEDMSSLSRNATVEVLHQPLFWSSETRLSFLRDVSDRVELEDRGNESDILKALENIAPLAFGGKWDEKLDAAFIADMGRYRKYRFNCVRDLLRVIRNKLNHYRELPKELQ